MVNSRHSWRVGVRFGHRTGNESSGMEGNGSQFLA